MGVSDPHFPYWGLSPEGGTRICYTGMSDGDIPDEPLCSETERAFALLKELATRLKRRHPVSTNQMNRKS